MIWEFALALFFKADTGTFYSLLHVREMRREGVRTCFDSAGERMNAFSPLPSLSAIMTHCITI